MRRTIVVVACLAALSACSKKREVVGEKGSDQAASTTANTAPADKGDASAEDAKTTEFMNAIKADFASQFVSTASEACASTKGQDMPDPKLGAPMQFADSGEISWGKGTLNYVKEPGSTIVMTNGRDEKTFAFGVDIYDLPKGDRKYVAGLSQLKGGSLSATVTDETKAVDGDSKLTTGNLCVGNVVPPLVTQGLWPLAAKHLQVAATNMSCNPLGKIEPQSMSISFDGKIIQAGTSTYTQADSAIGESLTIDPKGNTASVMYSVTKVDGTGVGLGLSRASVLTYASLELPGGVHLLCAPK